MPNITSTTQLHPNPVFPDLKALLQPVHLSEVTVFTISVALVNLNVYNAIRF